MDNSYERIYEEIREILEKNKDAEEGFSKAAEKASNSKLRDYFLEKSIDRKKFNLKLVEELRIEYPKKEVNGSFKGSIHRLWMDTKALFSMDNDESMLEETIRGEKAAIEEYNDVLDYKKLPVGIRHLLSEQRDSIQTDVRNKSILEDFK